MLDRITRKLALVLLKTARRLVMLHVSPLEAVRNIVKDPDISGPVILMLMCIALNWTSIRSRAESVYVGYPNGTLVPVASLLGENWLTIIFMQIAGVIALWFIAFIAFWYAVNTLGGSMLGSSSLSMAGYLVTVRLPLLTLTSLYSVLSSHLEVVIRHRVGAHPALPLELVSFLRSTYVAKTIGVPLNEVIVTLNYFYLLWSFLLSVLLVREGGVKGWKGVIAGCAVYGAVMFIAVVFRSVGIAV